MQTGCPEPQDSLESVTYNNDDTSTDDNANNLKCIIEAAIESGDWQVVNWIANQLSASSNANAGNGNALDLLHNDDDDDYHMRSSDTVLNVRPHINEY